MIGRLALILGAVSIIGQILLLRELITVFYGNETAYAVILASWLFWFATGSLTMSHLGLKIKFPRRLLAVFFISNTVISPLTIVATRLIRTVMHINIGETIGIIPMGMASFFLLAPLTFNLGAIFTLICRIPSKKEDTQAASEVGLIYLYESIGAAVGGCLYALVLIHIMPALHISFFMSLLNCVAVYLLAGQRNVLKKMVTTLFLCILVAFPLRIIHRLDDLTRRWQWREFNILTVEDSIYGNIALTRMDEEYSLYENGILSYSTRDDMAAEENTHYALLEHPEPKRVLLIGNGLAGALREILKHPVDKVDYIELDPAVIRISKDYLSREDLLPLGDKRVRVINTDGRMYVQQTGFRYDVIIVNLGDPYTAMINRYYSMEFFQKAARILTQKGIIALSVSSSENYIDKETRDFLRSIHTTLHSVFDDVIAIPGASNIFVGCKVKGVLTLSAKDLVNRLRARNIETHYVREYYLPFKLSPDRLAYMKGVLKEEGKLNTDLRPVTYFFDIILWSMHFNPAYKRLVEKLVWVKFGHLMIIPAILILVGFLLKSRKKRFAVNASIMTTGLSEIVFQLIVIIAFQTLYGFAYYKIGFIMSSFMIGLALGSMAARWAMAKNAQNIRKIYLWAQGGIVLYPLLLPFVFVLFREITTARNIGVFATTFTFLPVVAGFVGGLQYPLAAYLNLMDAKGGQEEGAVVAGGLYAFDTFGAMAGALVTGTMLIPLLGIQSVVYFCAVLNFAVFILLARGFYPAK